MVDACAELDGQVKIAARSSSNQVRGLHLRRVELVELVELVAVLVAALEGCLA
jgi:hypothetical protein